MTSRMKKRNCLYINLISLILLGLFTFWLTLSDAQRRINSFPITIKITSGNTTEEIKPWYDDNGKWYFFLPSYVNADNTVICPKARECYIQNHSLADELSLDAVKLGVEYDIRQHDFFADSNSTVIFMKSANIAAMYVDTLSGDMKNVHADKNVEEMVNITFYGENGEQFYKGNEFTDEISGHGNQTWNCEKKAYNLCFSEPQSFWESAPSKKWVLLANAYDNSNIRNPLFYKLAKSTSTVWNPVGDYVDLFLNGEYAGQYYLIEKVEVAADKVNISDNDILLNFELTRRADKYRIDEIFHGISAEVCYPKNLSEDKLLDEGEKIKKIIQTVKSGYATDDYITTHIDLESWSWIYILEELSCDYDAGACSQYLSFDGTQIKSQAAWDFDNSLGLQVHRSPTSFLAGRPWKDGETETSWFYSLLQYTVFQAHIKECFVHSYYPAVLKMINGEIQQLCQRIEESSIMDEVRWSLPIDSWQEDVEKVQVFLGKRISFLASAWIDDVEYHTVCLKGASQYLYYSVRDNTVFADIPSGEDVGINHFIAWIDEQTGEKFDAGQPVTRDITLYSLANVTMKERLGKWFSTHMSLLLLLMLCSMIACSGVVLIYLDVQRNR